MIKICKDTKYDGPLGHLNSKNWRERKYAIDSLPSLDESIALQFLELAFEDENSRIRQSAVNSLAKIGTPDALFIITKCGLTDCDGYVRSTAAKAIGNLGNKNSAMPLMLLMEKENLWFVKRVAIVSLGKLGNELAIGPLISSLEDDEWHVRAAAAKALENMPDNRVIEPLIKRINDDVLFVKKSALESLFEVLRNSSFPEVRRHLIEAGKTSSYEEKSRLVMNAVKRYEMEMAFLRKREKITGKLKKPGPEEHTGKFSKIKIR